MNSVVISVDVEQDCPPFLDTLRGVEEGLPRLLDLFHTEGVTGTFFTTGRVAELYPRIVARIVREGHELGCHGYSHRRFDRMGSEEARAELEKARAILDAFDDRMESFRAPNLQFPASYLGVLHDHRFRIDSSVAAYKPPFARRIAVVGGITRIPVTVTSSVLRLPLRWVGPVLFRARAPVLFVHPWEFVDMSHTPLRWDCKFNTGEQALGMLGALVKCFKAAGYRFRPIRDLVPRPASLACDRERRVSRTALSCEE